MTTLQQEFAENVWPVDQSGMGLNRNLHANDLPLGETKQVYLTVDQKVYEEPVWELGAHELKLKEWGSTEQVREDILGTLAIRYPSICSCS